MWAELAATLESMRSFWREISASFPALFAAAAILLAGWLLARVIRRGVLRFLRLIRADRLAENTGIETFLLQGGVRYTSVTLVANLVYWVIMFTVILAALHATGVRDAAVLFNKIILFMPNVIVALLVLMFGGFIARIVRAVTFTYLSNIGISGAEVIGHIAQWAILFFVISIALEQLSIGGQILVPAFQIAFGAVCLAFAIAFGLGGRAWAAQVLNRLWKP